MRNVIAKCCYIFILVIGQHFMYAQNTDFIKGQLLDAKTGEPVVFASIRMKGRALGVISNVDGSFKIPSKYKNLGEILEISSMGYQTQELLIHDFSFYTLNVVRLQPAVFELPEAVVKARKKKKLSARQIVRRSVNAILKNYATEEFSTIGYYRDYQLDSTNNYVNLNESILEVFEQGFAASDTATTKVRLYEYKQNTDFKRDTLSLKPYDYEFKEGRKVIDRAFLASYGGNEFTILRIHDAIRNYNINSYSFVHRLKSDLLSKHKFKKEPDTYLGDESLYTIRFSKTLPEYSAYGSLFISKHNYAIHKMEYAVFDNNKIMKDNLRNKYGSNKQLIFEVLTEYRDLENKMYLNYISFHNTFELWDPPKLVMEYVIPDFELKCFVIKFNDKVNLKDATSLDNYEVIYKGSKVPLLKAELQDQLDMVFLYPKLYPNKAEDMLRRIEIAARKDRITHDLFSFNIKNIKDEKGNVINQWTSRNYNQFREFFVQEVKPQAICPEDGLYMKKYQPIFKDQPISKPANFDDYWMNTPLQTIQEQME